MPSAIEEKSIPHEVENSGDDADSEASRLIADLKEKDLLSRKRSQTEMEPAAFELPRATKFPHKDFPPLPEFRSDSPPLMTFAEGHEDVFRARLSSKDACIQQTSFEEDMSVQEISTANILANAKEKNSYSPAPSGNEGKTVAIESQIQKSDVAEPPSTRVHGVKEGSVEAELQNPSADLNKTTSADYFNKTVDMTLRSSGIGACGFGMLLAVDEMLDPAIGHFVPYGLRRRGANVALFVATILLSIILWFLIL